jgi:hypothetical protein
VQTAAGENELRYGFGPTLGRLLQFYGDFSRHADFIVLQSQRWQLTADYEEQVEDLIAKIRSVNPEVEVWVQVAVNPPEKRDATADEVVSDIRRIADQADAIAIYYPPKKAPILEEVLKRLRQ